MATYANVIRVNAGVSVGGGTPPGESLYTAPANGYAIVQLSVAGGDRIIPFFVGGRLVETLHTSPSGTDHNESAYARKSIYVGAGQLLETAGITGTGAFSVHVSGVEFVNAV